MTSVKSRLDSFYAQQRKNTLVSRFQFVYAIVVAICYMLWNTTPPAERIARFAVIFAVIGAVALLIYLWTEWRIRRVINRLRSLAPDDRDEVLGRHLTPEAREFYTKRLAAEGSIEFDGMVERFPFSAVDRREALALFWGAAAIGALTLAAALGIGGEQESWRAPALAIGMIAVLGMPALSRRLYRLASVRGKLPRAADFSTDCDLPVFSEYRLHGARWVSIDSLRTAPPCNPLPGTGELLRIDSGYLRVAAETLHLYVDDRRIGSNGWVGFALLRSDTLLFPGGVFEPYDPGDMVSLRLRSRARH